MTREDLPEDVIRLWPDGPPSKIEGVGPETEFRGFDGVSAGTLMLRNVSEATLTVFRPAKPNGIGVIVCPAAVGASWPGSMRGSMSRAGSQSAATRRFS